MAENLKVESREKVGKSKVESREKVESRKTSEAQLRAIQNYEKKFKRINCRLSPDMWEKIERTGESANTIITRALDAYFN